MRGALCFRSIQPQEEAVVEMGGIIDAVLIEDQCIGERTDLQQSVPVSRVSRQP